MVRNCSYPTDFYVKRLINGISFPKTNAYYENDSADGFAFLGAARQMVGLDSEECRVELTKRNYTLNAERKIGATGASVHKNTQYVYTLWSCMELFSLLKDEERINFLCDTVDKIGRYENGMVRYCTTEIRYVVPNVTSAAALMFSIKGEHDKATELIDVLEKNQCENGNWRYEIIDEITNVHTPHKCEDSYHLAMMIYHLRGVARLSNLNANRMIDRGLSCLVEMNEKSLSPGSVGWGIPMLYLAVDGKNPELSKRAYYETIKDSISHPNFRTRALSAFCIAKAQEVK